MRNISPELEHAITKAIASEFKDSKAEIGQTSFRGKVVIDLDVNLLRGEDEEYTPTAEIPILKVLALCLSRAGFQRQAIEQLIVNAVTEAVNQDAKIDEILKVTELAIERVKQEVQSKLPKKTRAGKTQVKGVVRLADVISVEEVENSNRILTMLTNTTPPG